MNMRSSKNNQTQELLKKISRLEEQVQDFERLNQFLQKISSATNVEDTLKQISEQTLRFCRADESSIILTGLKEPREEKTLLRESESGAQKQDNCLHWLW